MNEATANLESVRLAGINAFAGLRAVIGYVASNGESHQRLVGAALGNAGKPLNDASLNFLQVAQI